MTARAQTEKIWVDYEGLKFYLRMTVAWPIGDVACDNTDSIFPPGPISCFVYHSANQIGLCKNKNVLGTWSGGTAGRNSRLQL